MLYKHAVFDPIRGASVEANNEAIQKLTGGWAGGGGLAGQQLVLLITLAVHWHHWQ